MFSDGTTMSSASATLPGTTGQVPYFSANNTAVGTSSVFIASTGNLGIGTVIPVSLLEMKSATPILTFTATNSSNPYGLQFNSSDASIKQTAATGELQINVGRSVGWGGHATFYTDTFERMRISSNGSVGIGITSPTNGLDVSAGTLPTQLPRRRIFLASMYQRCNHYYFLARKIWIGVFLQRVRGRVLLRVISDFMFRRLRAARIIMTQYSTVVALWELARQVRTQHFL